MKIFCLSDQFRKCADNKTLRINLLFRTFGKEGDGVLLLTKRLLAGNRFQWPRTPDEARELTTEQFRRLMDGFTIEGTIKEIFPSKKADLENSRTQA